MIPVSTPAEVGERISSERNESGLSQVELAERAGITRERLAGYEKGRGCLRCGIAFDLCLNLVVSEHWLATGQGDKNCYVDVAAFFPKEKQRKPFLDMYDSDIRPIYEQHRYNDSFIPLLRYDDLHPDTWRIACFKMLRSSANPIKDSQSLSWYWMDIAEYAGRSGLKYSKPPRERLIYLNTQLFLVKDGREIPFSYETLFDDLTLIGVGWGLIENLAGKIRMLESPIPIEKLKETVLLYLKELGQYKAYSLYQKIYCEK